MKTPEHFSGYVGVLAKLRAAEWQRRRWFGEPYLYLGQCIALTGYFFQLGSLLSVKHRVELAAFVHAFLGLTGEPGAAERYCDMAMESIKPLLEQSKSIHEFVEAELKQRLAFCGDSTEFLMKHGMAKIRIPDAAEMACQFARSGTVLGALRPATVRTMFDETHRAVPRADWNRARAAGLAIPTEQDITTYEQVEKDEDDLFMEYCRTCCPSLHSTLASGASLNS